MSKNSIQAITLTSLDSATLAGAYKAINGTGTTEACLLVRIINDSDTDVLISFDGTTDHDYVRTGSVLELNLQTNSQVNNLVAKLGKGTVVYAKSAAGTGNIYLAGYYQPI